MSSVQLRTAEPGARVRGPRRKDLDLGRYLAEKASLLSPLLLASKNSQRQNNQLCATNTDEGGLSLEMRAVIDACARGVARGLEAVAEREAARLRAGQDERAAMIQAVEERESVMRRAV